MGALVSAAGGILGNQASQGDVNASMAAQQAALAAIQGVNAPTLASLQVQLQQEQMMGQEDPILQAEVNQAQSAAQGITTDPGVQAAQMQSLAQMQQLSQAGLRPQDIAAIMQVNNQALGTANAQQASLMQQMQQQGQGNGGASLAARMLAGQSAANTEMQGGLQVSGQAALNAQNAMQNAAQQANTMQTNSFGQQMQQATAQNAINQFNAQNANQINANNAAAQNAAMQYNVGTKQQVANNNADIANQQITANAAANQTLFNDQMGKASAEQSAYGNVANQNMAQAGRTQQLYSGVASSLGNAVNSGIGYATAPSTPAKTGS